MYQVWLSVGLAFIHSDLFSEKVSLQWSEVLDHENYDESTDAAVS